MIPEEWRNSTEKGSWDSPYCKVRNSNVRLVINDRYDKTRYTRNDPMKKTAHGWIYKHFDVYMPFVVIALIALILAKEAHCSKVNHQNNCDKDKADNNKNFVIEDGVKFDTRY